MTAAPTQIALQFLPDRVNHWLRFGRPSAERVLDRRRAVAMFEPGQLCGYVRWQANDHGTVLWQVFVLRTGRPGDRLTRVPGVVPGAELLLRAARRPAIAQAFAAIDALEAAGFDPAAITPDYWRHVHNRLAVNAAVRAYDREQDRAWRARRALVP
jgi:hypothetical protein